MNTLLKMAWRNIWRNKRRTFITTAAIAFAVFFDMILIATFREPISHSARATDSGPAHS